MGKRNTIRNTLSAALALLLTANGCISHKPEVSLAEQDVHVGYAEHKPQTGIETFIGIEKDYNELDKLWVRAYDKDGISSVRVISEDDQSIDLRKEVRTLIVGPNEKRVSDEYYPVEGLKDGGYEIILRDEKDNEHSTTFGIKGGKLEYSRNYLLGKPWACRKKQD